MSASFSITIEGKGTFTASIADPEASVTVGTNTPASFTAEVAPVGPAGATGATGPAGVVAATAPITYNSGTQTVGISATPTFTSVTATTGNLTTVNLTTATFADATSQTTAFPPAGGTVSQYIDGTGALETFPAVGDRYLTSSTSTLTCDNANGKTMTVGTGLAYTAQQDITVLYDNSNHMHGTVTSYNSGTGVLVFDSNTHSGGPGPFSNWVVNVGGVAGAILPVGGTAGQVLSKINSTNFNTEWVSLDYAPIASPTFTGTVTIPAGASISGFLTTATAASTYAPLASPTFTGTVTIPAGASISGFALLASPTFTGDPKAPTPTAGDNDTSIATTAFVNTYCPSASDTVAGKVELATTAEAIAGTDTTRAVTADGVKAVRIKASCLSIGTATMSSATSGTGASVAQNGNQKQVSAPTTAIGYGSLYYNFLVHPLQAYNTNIDWSKRHEFEFLLVKGVNTSDANTVGRVKIGQPSFSGVAGDLAARGVGIRFAGNGNIFLMVHDGTTLTTVDSGIAASGSAVRLILKILSDGAGNVSLFSNGTQVATTTAGPTSQGGGNGVIFEAQNLAIIATQAQQIVYANFTADFGY